VCLPIEAKSSTMAWLPLLLYAVLKGLNATALKGLQAFGATHPIGGGNPISVCKVFFVAQLIVLGLLLVQLGSRMGTAVGGA
jgi:hypothetical protein